MWLHVRIIIYIYIYNYIYIYIIYMYISVKMAAPWGSLTLLSFHSLCLHLRRHLTKWKCSRTRLRNTKPAQSLRRTFSKRNSQKKNRSDDKMVARRLLFTRLEIAFVTISSFTKRTKVVPRVFQEDECGLEGLITLAFGLQLQMLPKLNGHFMNVLVWFCT